MELKYTEKSGQLAYILVKDDTLKYVRNINGKLYTIEQNVGELSLVEFMERISTISKLDNSTFIMFDNISRSDKLD